MMIGVIATGVASPITLDNICLIIGVKFGKIFKRCVLFDRIMLDEVTMLEATDTVSNLGVPEYKHGKVCVWCVFKITNALL